MTRVRLSGWGRTPSSVAELMALDAVGALNRRGLERGMIARGCGRSYGDCAQNAGGRVLATTSDSSVVLDDENGVVVASGGSTLQAILDVIVPKGWFLPVTPGTKHVTVGGAIGSDVHGKNHHRAGSFSEHVAQLELMDPTGKTRTVAHGSDMFRATAGGMGLTGIVTSAIVKLIPIESSAMAVNASRFAGLDALMDEMESGDGAYTYSVAWVDAMATGAAMGRGVLLRGEHAPRGAHGADSRSGLGTYRMPRTVSVPDVLPPRLLNRGTTRLFNEMWYRRARRSQAIEMQSINQFFYPLDSVDNWNRLYGRRGFVQYQVAIPTGAARTIEKILSHLSSTRTPVSLAVLKRLGPGVGLLSFPIEGWTLAVDIPVAAPGLSEMLASFDEQVAEVGGRVYLAKDSRMRPELFKAMYPEHGAWLRIRDTIDPERVWRSDLARRLEML